MSHLKRLAVSKQVPLTRKEGTKYITRPAPGAYKISEGMALAVLLRDICGMVQTLKEAKRVLNAGKVLVDGVVRKDHKFPVGFLSHITFTDITESYYLSYNNRGKLELKNAEKGFKKPLKVTGKKMMGKDKIQVNLFNGQNILVKKADYKVGDSVVVNDKKVTGHLKFEKGAKVFLIAGKHVGHNGVIEEIKERKDWSHPQLVIVKTKTGTFETPKEYAFVVDKDL